MPEAASTRRVWTGAVAVITDFWLDLLEGLVNWVSAMLPTDTVLGDQNIGFQIFSGANYFFPLAEMSAVLLGLIALALPMSVVSLVLWLAIGVVRGGSSKA